MDSGRRQYDWGGFAPILPVISATNNLHWPLTLNIYYRKNLTFLSILCIMFGSKGTGLCSLSPKKLRKIYAY